ncbi:hypothetical protein UA08_01697 [Talaromyces atroroseus]|uniref:Uncharacterized protein n=1 Tax=Talaromyces atroroseus TaxID=1441469 RepID=A0A1Q5QBW5_TALAT|nr:hypothetical protein UA08_01697 [Talaromyces atroroseus]OKL63371.1 hypothetical protein UA08_01697 [Talaromyces atroroseus]
MSDIEKSDVEKEAEAAAPTTDAVREPPNRKIDEVSKELLRLNKATEAVAEQDENVPPPPPLTKWQKVKRHFRRFWICYLIALIIFLAIFLPCLFLLIIPRIAQDLLNRGSIVINNASILQPQNDSVILSISSNIYIPGPFTVNTQPEHLQMYIPQTGSQYPMVQLNLPGAKVHKNTTIEETGQYTPLENYTTWHEFVHDTIFLNDGSLGLKGSVVAQLGKIKSFTLDLNKVAPAKGLNQFSGFSIDSASLVLPAESDGTNLIANATLPNQSILTLEIGNTTLNILSGDIVIGTGVIENLLLRPGNNTVQIRGTANLTTIMDNLSTIISQQGPYIKNGYLALTSQVTDISYNGSNVPYYTEEMSKVSLTAQTPLLGMVLSTLQGFLSSEAANGTNLTATLENSIEADYSRSNSVKRIRDVLDNSTEIELITRNHLERLAKL